MSNVIKDEQFTYTDVDAIIEIKSEGFLPDIHSQSVTIENATEVFAIFAKPCNAITDYTMITAGEYGAPDFDSMIEWLKENDPDKYSQLLYAILYHADEEELDAALIAAGWDNDLLTDIAIYIEYDWLLEELGQETAEKFLNELSETLEAYLNINKYSNLSSAIIEISYEDPDGECDDPEDPDLPYEITLSEDIPLTPESAAGLKGDIEEHIILRLLEKYNLVEDANPDDLPKE